MEAQSSDDPTYFSIKETKTRLESRIDTLHTTQLDLIASLQSLVPNVVSSLDLSLKALSTFNSSNKPYTPLSQFLPSNPTFTRSHHFPKHNNPSSPENDNSTPALNKDSKASLIEESGGSLSIVRSMVAGCLMERTPFTAIDSSTIVRKLENDPNVTVVEKEALRDLGGESGAIAAVEIALRSIGEDNGGVELEEFVVSGKSGVIVMKIDRTRLLREFPESKMFDSDRNNNPGSEKKKSGVQDVWMGGPRREMGIVPIGVGVPPPVHRQMGYQGGNVMVMKPRTEEEDMKDVEAIVNKKSFKEMQKSQMGEEILDLIQRPTAKETAIANKFKTRDGSQVTEYCSALTKEDCRRRSALYISCEKVHFRRIIAAHTDMNLGDCSFLDTCRHMKTCKFVHYELDSTSPTRGQITSNPSKPLKPHNAHYCSEAELGSPQWINCDIRSFRMDILGQFGVIMADPPWDIHMELPYGTMADEEMRTLNVPALQTDGLIFLWVTGRAMELGRECLDLWGYKRVEEIIWVKTNQLQRIIRTGRTGHWLNHSKEHCLVGVKGNPEVNRNIDTDVIVAEVRETSRKPDEMYAMLERISQGTRKLELFARYHNVQAGWLSMGNQLPGVRLVDEGLRARFKAAYPDVEVQPASPPRTAVPMDVDQPTPPPSRIENSAHLTEPSGQAAAPNASEPNASNADVDMTS